MDLRLNDSTHPLSPTQIMEQTRIIASSTPALKQDLPILFTSFHCWPSFAQITDERQAIASCHEKIVAVGERSLRLNLLHYNIPCGPLSHLPTPAEIKAVMLDMNEVTHIVLIGQALKDLPLDAGPILDIAARVDALRKLSDSQFIEKEQGLLQQIDAFRAHLPVLRAQLIRLPPSPFVMALTALCDKKIKGVERLAHIDLVACSLGYVHTTRKG